MGSSEKMFVLRNRSIVQICQQCWKQPDERASISCVKREHARQKIQETYRGTSAALCASLLRAEGLSRARMASCDWHDWERHVSTLKKQV